MHCFVELTTSLVLFILKSLRRRNPHNVLHNSSRCLIIVYFFVQPLPYKPFEKNFFCAGKQRDSNAGNFQVCLVEAILATNSNRILPK